MIIEPRVVVGLDLVIIEPHVVTGASGPFLDGGAA